VVSRQHPERVPTTDRAHGAGVALVEQAMSIVSKPLREGDERGVRKAQSAIGVAFGDTHSYGDRARPPPGTPAAKSARHALSAAGPPRADTQLPRKDS
jgi:hypothetical protein